ncbi:DUF3794 domain-containing protein [Clostridium algidicarnis]|uniref:DUF3794 and LysM peptidoglycan-binding domain-containing protein n=1 Tax=Clostridium algidicarnis TaxID=37659 RepID=UPI001C0B8D8C|nr:SPOCS domain-containing protein [Clostridium algidicarnis]MBU3205937.1 DUF3794 domain-containing protein [Clostridium algidicarnis]
MQDIDVVRESIQYEQLLGENTSDTVFRGEYLIPDTHPDVLEILTVDVKPVIVSKNIMPDKIYVEGTLEYTILYLANEDEDRRGVQSINYSDKFSNYVDINGADQSMNCLVECDIEHMGASIVNERKIGLEGIVKIKAEVLKEYNYDIIKDIESTENLEMLKEPYILDQIIDNVEKDFTAKSVINIGMDKPQIGNILKKDVSIYKKDIKIVDNEVHVNGFVIMKCIYRGLDSKEVVYLEDEIFIKESFEIEHIRDDMRCIGDITLSDIYIDINHDDIGEKRIINVEYSLRSNFRIMSKENIHMIEDAYSPSALLEIEKEKYSINILQGMNNSEVIVKENIQIGKGRPKPIEILMTTGNVAITEKKVLEDKISIEGVIKVEILYRSKEDRKNICVVKEELSFSTGIDIPGAKIDMTCISKANLEVLESSIEADTIAIKCVVLVFGSASYLKEKEFLISISKLDDDVPEKKASITIYVVQQEDTLWKIAKRYFTTTDEIVKVNNIEDPDSINVGDKIIIPGRAIL